MVVRQGELEIVDLEEEERLRVALYPHRSLKPTRELPMELPQRVVVPQQHPAAQARQDEVERQGAAQMAQLPVLLESQACQLQELPQAWPPLVHEQAVAHQPLEAAWQGRAQLREALLQDAWQELDLRELHRETRALPQPQAPHLQASLRAARPVAQV
jgi:hypothetical protein